MNESCPFEKKLLFLFLHNFDIYFFLLIQNIKFVSLDLCTWIQLKFKKKL